MVAAWLLVIAGTARAESGGLTLATLVTLVVTLGLTALVAKNRVSS